MKIIARTVSFCLSVAILLFGFNYTAFSEENENYELSVDEIISAIEPLISAEEEYYTIHDIAIDSAITELADDGIFKTICSVRLSMCLKATCVDELPYIEGILEAVGVDRLEKCTPSELMKCESTRNLQMSETESVSAIASHDNASYLFAKTVADKATGIASLYSSYIGITSDFVFDIAIESDAEYNIIGVYGIGDTAAKDNSTFFPLSDYYPPEKETMREQGRIDLLAEIRSVQIGNAESINSLPPLYNNTAACNYAIQYSSEASVSQTCPHGNTRIDLSKYSSFYTYYCHKDCANFVSQCICAGNIPTDAVWYPTSYSWATVSGLRNYFYTQKNYWKTSSFFACNAGGIIINQNTSGEYYHVNLCVYNDTITHKYAAHNADHNNKVFTSTYWGSDTMLYYLFKFSTNP